MKHEKLAHYNKITSIYKCFHLIVNDGTTIVHIDHLNYN